MSRRKTSIAVAVILLLFVLVAIRASFNKDVEDMTPQELIEALKDTKLKRGIDRAVEDNLRKVGVNRVPKFIGKITGMEYRSRVWWAFITLGSEDVPALIKALQDEDEDEWVRIPGGLNAGVTPLL